MSLLTLLGKLQLTLHSLELFLLPRPFLFVLLEKLLGAGPRDDLRLLDLFLQLRNDFLLRINFGPVLGQLGLHFRLLLVVGHFFEQRQHHGVEVVRVFLATLEHFGEHLFHFEHLI